MQTEAYSRTTTTPNTKLWHRPFSDWCCAKYQMIMLATILSQHDARLRQYNLTRLKFWHPKEHLKDCLMYSPLQMHAPLYLFVSNNIAIPACRRSVKRYAGMHLSKFRAAGWSCLRLRCKHVYFLALQLKVSASYGSIHWMAGVIALVWVHG